MAHSNTKHPNDPEQIRWLTQTKNGDRLAFNHIVAKYQQPIYNFCYGMLKYGEEAEDATQETFLRAFTKLDSYDETRSFSTWLFSIAANYCRDLLRKRRSGRVAWDALVSARYPPAMPETVLESALIRVEATQEVRSLLKILPPEQRTAIILKYWYAMSYEEMAQTLNTTVSAIKNKLFRARKIMAQTTRRERVGLMSGHFAPATNG
jgi:RNA polymerase sigma-70 factor (ECF subfamily)